MTAMTLTLPLPPNMANGRLHWRTKHRERLSYLGACDMGQATGAIPPPPRRPFAEATVAATLTVWSLMDDDNAMARAKWALDWLVTRGYLAGDSRKHIRWAGIPAQIVDRKTSGAITFTITPAPAGGAR